jgi:GNAT superfamily N-acetyltransferase
MTFVDAQLASRIDHVEASLAVAACAGARGRITGAAPSVVDLAGGLAVLLRPGSPLNKVIGAGYAGSIDPPALTALEATWDARGEPVRIELATLAAPEALEPLPARGYRLVGFEHVLLRSLSEAVPLAAAPGVEVRAGTDDAAWARVGIAGFGAPDGTGAEADPYGQAALEAVTADFGATPGLARYVAWLDGVPVGAASMWVDDRIALLCGATTLPAARRRGVQRALLAARLADAKAAGCELATVTTAPGSTSQHNVMRSAFALGFARGILVRALPERV